jgi:hypothetical protein
VTIKLRAQLDAAMAAIPPAHRRDLAAAEAALEAREEERREEEDLVEAAWVADTQLQLSQLSYLDVDDDRLEDTDLHHTSDNEDDAGLGCQADSQAQPLEISSSDESDDGKPRRSGRVRRVTRIVESQLSQIEKGLIPAPVPRPEPEP